MIRSWFVPGALVCFLLVGVFTGTPWSFASVVLCLPAYLFGRRSPSFSPAVLALGLGLLLQLCVAWVREPASFLSLWTSFLLTDTLTLVVPWWFGTNLRVRAERRAEEREFLADLARARERARIAEDMHDGLGHELAFISLQAGALELLPDPEGTHHEIAARIREHAVAATDRLHETLGVLRSEDAPARLAPADADAAGIVEAARASGLEVTFEVEGTLPTGVVAQALCRILREGLTNAVKHSPGAAVAVSVESAGTEVVLRIDSAAPEREHTAARGSGSGLVAAAERARLLGGSLEAGEHAGGFRVTARLPRVPSRPTAGAPEDLGFRDARRSSRAGLGRAAIVPAACAVLLCVVLAGFQVLTYRALGLEEEAFAALGIGMTHAEAAEHLPPEHLSGSEVPASVPLSDPPAGADCEFYLARKSALDLGGEVHRVCFVDDRITTLDTFVPEGRS